MCVQSEYYSSNLQHAADLLFEISLVNALSKSWNLYSLEKTERTFSRNSSIWQTYGTPNSHLT